MKFAIALVSTVAATQPSFKEWAAQYGFNGVDDVLEAKYTANVAIIDDLNAQDSGATFAVNQFAGMTREEYKAFLSRSNKKDRSDAPPSLGVHSHDGSELAASVDWVTKGAVTPVKDQGQCGGCWSFAATGGLEGAWELASGSLTSLSEQQFLDCDTEDSGCNGGLEYEGWNFFKSKDEGICTEQSYPYKAKDGTCKYSSCTLGIPAGGIAGVTHVKKGSSSDLQSALQKQPVSIGIQADQSSFQFYSGGILTAACGKQLDHSVLAVGYDTGSQYWLVKNSWGASWGDKGYIKLTMTGDQCGILDDASYPSVSASLSV
jgi:KDEL-tailed cysteine endopeptidase